MTAVEYLIKEFSNILGKIQTKTLQDSVFLIDAIEKAKEMEKQQQDKFAIGFAEWSQYEMPIEYFTYHTSQELLEIYKKEKGL